MKNHILHVLIQNGEKYMVANSQQYKEVYNQIEEAYGKIVYTYTTHIIQASRIKKKNAFLKWSEIILSAISAGGFLATVITDTAVLAWIGGLCSTALLVLSSYFKELDLVQVQKEHLNTSNKLWALREDYLSLLIDFDRMDYEAIKETRKRLKEEVTEVYNHAPITDEKSYTLAQEELQKKESQFFTRDELNNILPVELRK